MAVSSRGGLLGFVARLGRPPAADSDAALVDRFVRTGDGEAFAGLVRRYGPMVLAVCRRRLGRDSDAEDAFQAVFLVLARKAAGITQRDALPGWLYRAAHLIALKAAARRARHPAAPLPAAEPAMPDPPTPGWEAADLGTLLDAELAALPDRLRAVAVLRLVEGRSAAEAAATLGVPVGTVDSRLHAARERLKARLARRGVAVVAGVAFERLLGDLRAAAGPGFEQLAEETTHAVLAAVAGGAVSPAVNDLAHGVTLMTTTRLRVWATIGLAVGLLGSAAGFYLAPAADRPQAGLPLAGPATPAADEVQPAKKEEDLTAPDKGTDTLDKLFPLKVGDNGVPLGELFGAVEDSSDVVIRVDVAAFRRLRIMDDDEPMKDFLKRVYDTQVVLPRRADRLTTREVLGDAIAQVPGVRCTFQVRGNQIVIVPAYQPSGRAGVNVLDPPADDEPQLPANVIHEQVHGPPVVVAADRKQLPAILADLRKQTGANIVLDPRCEADGKLPPVTVTLTDVRLYDALRVLADMSGLKLVYAGNVYYVTTVQNAKQFQPPTQRPTFGGPVPGPVPGGPGGP